MNTWVGSHVVDLEKTTDHTVNNRGGSHTCRLNCCRIELRSRANVTAGKSKAESIKIRNGNNTYQCPVLGLILKATQTHQKMY